MSARGLRAAVLLALAGCAAPAMARPAGVCADRATVLRHLAAEYAEAPVGAGLAHTGAVVELLAAEAGRSWTLIVTLPDGTSCLIAAGESWQTLARPARRDPPA